MRVALFGIILAFVLLAGTYLLYRWFVFKAEQEHEKEMEEEKTMQELFEDEDL